MSRLWKIFVGGGLMLAAALALSPPARAQAAPACFNVSPDGVSYTICRFDMKSGEVRLFWRGADGAPLGGFDALTRALPPDEKLLFAMNAGMFDDHQAPVGLLIEKGVELHGANTRAGPGNFHLKPNGVFYVGPEGAGVMETARFLSQRPAADYATQSGPMLVIDGRIHPKIQPDGASQKIRNGVGVDREGKIDFVISNQPVTFYQFATLFKDKLGCDNALFLDGSVSALYAPNLNRKDFVTPLGPMVGVVQKGG